MFIAQHTDFIILIIHQPTFIYNTKNRPAKVGFLNKIYKFLSYQQVRRVRNIQKQHYYAFGASYPFTRRREDAQQQHYAHKHARVDNAVHVRAYRADRRRHAEDKEQVEYVRADNVADRDVVLIFARRDDRRYKLRQARADCDNGQRDDRFRQSRDKRERFRAVDREFAARDHARKSEYYKQRAFKPRHVRVAARFRRFERGFLFARYDGVGHKKYKAYEQNYAVDTRQCEVAVVQRQYEYR